jgi:hypothetical protein
MKRLDDRANPGHEGGEGSRSEPGGRWIRGHRIHRSLVDQEALGAFSFPLRGGWPTLYKRIREWEWVRPGKAMPARDGEALLPEPGNIPDWLEDAAEAAELEALERNARRLAAVAKGVAALEKIDGAARRPSPAMSDDPTNAEAMREELRRRLEVLAVAAAGEE